MDGNHANWLQTQNILLNHFQNSATEFLWEESNVFSSNILDGCIIMQCILIQIHYNKLDTKLRTLSNKTDFDSSWGIRMSWRNEIFERILSFNTRAVASQKHASMELLLVSDSTFPREQWGNLALQSQLPERERIILPTAIVLKLGNPLLFEIDLRRLVIPLYTLIPIILANDKANIASIGCFGCTSSIQKYTWPLRRGNFNDGPAILDLFYALKPEVMPSRITSFLDIIKFWKKIHTNLIFKETEPSNYPKSVKDAVARSDFAIIAPLDFLYAIMLAQDPLSEPTNQPERFSILIYVLEKSSFVWGNIQYGLENAVKGKPTEVVLYEHFYNPKNIPEIISRNNISTVQEFFQVYKYGIPDQKQFTKIVALCKNDCKTYWTVALLNMQKVCVVVPEHVTFHSTIEFTTMEQHAEFKHKGFFHFFGVSVHSGLHDLSMTRFQMLQRVQTMRLLNKFGELGMGNGSVFSYVFLKKDKQVDDEPKSAKMTAFIGTTIITTVMTALSFVVFVYEIRNRNIFV
ncbi:unnamed protein product [Orchesella dallaii]|uniref:Receptor ligand binding region domain-containing protein n=1 Tax=Orchesella dallaii TaxID=48710 RepID=A0ABP1RPN6_9HEXA